MKALLMYQPTASLLTVGATRLVPAKRFTTYRGPVAICAAKWFPLRDRVLLKQNIYREALGNHYLGDVLDEDYLPTGAIVAVGQLTGLTLSHDPVTAQMLEECPFHFARIYEPKYVWHFAEMRPLEIPIKWYCQPGLTDVPAHISERFNIFINDFEGKYEQPANTSNPTYTSSSASA